MVLLSTSEAPGTFLTPEATARGPLLSPGVVVSTPIPGVVAGRTPRVRQGSELDVHPDPHHHVDHMEGITTPQETSFAVSTSLYSTPTPTQTTPRITTSINTGLGITSPSPHASGNPGTSTAVITVATPTTS